MLSNLFLVIFRKFIAAEMQSQIVKIPNHNKIFLCWPKTFEKIQEVWVKILIFLKGVPPYFYLTIK